MTMPMVERVARAIAEAYGEPDFDALMEKADRSTNESKEGYYLLAVAAIEAMRDPTIGMGLAGLITLERVWLDSTTPKARASWEAMIDAALEGSQHLSTVGEATKSLQGSGATESKTPPPEKKG